MATLILHIGTHETGITAVQDIFAASRAGLAEHGVIYPGIGGASGHHGLAGDWTGLPPSYRLEGGAGPAWAALARAHADTDATVFLSSEAFCRGAPRPVDMAALRDRMAGFGAVRILCVLRDQASFLQSVWLEIARKRRVPAFGQYLKEALKTGFADGLWLDYGALYDHLLTGFAPEEIEFLSHDAVSSHPGGAAGYMCQYLGLPEAALTAPDAQSNVSPDPLAFWAAASTAAPARPDAALMALAGRVLAARAGADKRSTLFTRAELARVAARYAPRNAALARRLAPHQPEFAPPAFPDWSDRIHREDLGNRFWIELAQRLWRG